MFDTTRSTSVNRREVLKVGGVTATSITWATGIVAATGNRQVEFVRYLLGQPPNREKVYDTIPEDEWGDRHTARDLGERIDDRIDRKWGDPLLKTFFGPLSESPTGFGVKVNYTTYIDHDGQKKSPDPSVEEVRSELPDKGSGEAKKGEHHETRQNLPVRVIETTERPTNCSGEHNNQCQDSYDYEDIPGGIPVYHPDKDSFCSLCAAWNDDLYGASWIGSGHCATEGEMVENGGDQFGTVEHKKITLGHDIDYCVIQSDHTDDPIPRIADEQANGNYDFDVTGIVTDSALQNDTDSSEEYLTQGRTTCRISDTLKDFCVSGDCVTSYHDHEAGDSGGTLFHTPNNTDACIAGVIVSEFGDDGDSDSCGDYTKSTTAETLENKRGGNFMTV